MVTYPKLKFKIRTLDSEQIGVFVWGSAREEIFNEYSEIMNIDDPEEKLEALEDLIEDDPEFIDGYGSIGWWELEHLNYGNALLYFSGACAVADAVIPSDYDGKIPWSATENRAYLQALHGLGLVYLFLREWDDAVKIFEKILRYNPEDNQGIRVLALECYMALGRFEDIIGLVTTYSDDIMPDLIYGTVYAHYHLENMKNAEVALALAVELSPLVAKELVKKHHIKVDSDKPGHITLDSAEEAFDYWHRVGHFWTHPKLLKFIESGLKKFGK